MDARRPPQILVVDDDPAVLNALVFALRLDGFDVTGFASAEALLAERSLPIRGCIVTDYRMPGLDGVELVGRLRARGVELPAILITTPTSAVKRLAEAANIPIVEKPLVGGALADRLNGLIDAAND
ncbi:MAG: response regulator [Caulobacteraceae bacterium]